MNLIVRMISLLIKSWFKPGLPIDKPANTLSMRVLPNDIDINMHMNNGRYLTICDLSRVDMFIRTGLARTMINEKWMPVISEHTMKYKKPLKMFQRYEVSMQVTGWDEKSFYMTHTFVVKDRVVAEGTSLGVVVGHGGVVAPALVIKTVADRLGVSGPED